MANTFDELIEEAKNENTLEETTASSQYHDGDTCGKNGCEKSLHENHYPRDPDSRVEPHSSYNEYEYVCVHHGIVVTE